MSDDETDIITIIDENTKDFNSNPMLRNKATTEKVQNKSVTKLNKYIMVLVCKQKNQIVQDDNPRIKMIIGYSQ